MYKETYTYTYRCLGRKQDDVYRESNTSENLWREWSNLLSVSSVYLSARPSLRAVDLTNHDEPGDVHQRPRAYFSLDSTSEHVDDRTAPLVRKVGSNRILSSTGSWFSLSLISVSSPTTSCSCFFSSCSSLFRVYALSEQSKSEREESGSEKKEERQRR